MSKLWPSSHHHHHHAGDGGANNNPNNNNNNGGGATTTTATGDGSLTRTVLVHISGNRATWEHLGIHGAVWQVNPERAPAIFADAYPETQAEQAAIADRLGRAMIRSVTLLESNTNIDEVVAVQIDGLPPREFTKNGEGASLYLTGDGRVTEPQRLFTMTGNTELGIQWMKQFPRYTSENLDRVGIMFLTGASYYFVHEEHPVIHFLRANEDQLGIQIFKQPSLEGGWIRIDVDAFVYTVRTLRETVLRNTPSTFNLANLTVRVTKPEAQRWLQLCPQLISSLLSDEVRESNDPELITEARRLGVQRYFDRPLFVTLRLSIEYVLPETVASDVPIAPSAQQLAASAASSAVGMSGNNNNNTNNMGGGSNNNTNPNSNNNGNNNNINSNNNNAPMMMMMAGPAGSNNNNNNNIINNNNNGNGGLMLMKASSSAPSGGGMIMVK